MISESLAGSSWIIMDSEIPEPHATRHRPRAAGQLIPRRDRERKGQRVGHPQPAPSVASKRASDHGGFHRMS